MKPEIKDPEMATAGDVCHRAKNDLQTAATLLTMAAPHVKTPEQLAKAVEPRIFAMSIPYSLAGPEGRLPTFGGLVDLVLRLVMPGGGEAARCRVDAMEGGMSLRAAGPLCLWLFEVCSNAFKHGFSKTREPEIDIDLCLEGDSFVARVEDNGPGLPESFSRPASFGLGLKIASAIAEIDFRGQLLLDSAKGKMTVCLKSPLGEFQRIIGVNHAAAPTGVDLR